MVKETYLHDKHVALGAKMIDFGGWHMPVQYSSIIDEHKTVRENVGLFDVSHMGEVFVSGKDATAFLNKIVPQDITKLDYEKAVYCQLPKENGGLIEKTLEGYGVLGRSSVGKPKRRSQPIDIDKFIHDKTREKEIPYKLKNKILVESHLKAYMQNCNRSKKLSTITKTQFR